MMSLRSVSVNRWSSGRLWSLAKVSSTGNQQFSCLHHHSPPPILLQPKYQRAQLFSQVRTINIAGEDSLEKARRPNWQQKTNGDQQQQQERSSKRRTPLAYMFALLPVATFCLGTWQIYRLRWKLELIAKLEHLVKSPPVEFPENLTNLQEQEYLKVRLTGYFDAKSEPIFIFPRPLLKESSTSNKQPESGGGGLFSSSNSSHIGAQLVLPFVVTESRLVEAYNQLLLDSGREDLLISDNSNGNKQQPMRILVNVGWVPRETMDRVNRSYYGTKNSNSSSSPQSAYNQEIELIGVIRKTEKREPFTAKKDTGHGYVSRRDISKISEALDTTPIFLDAYQSYPISLAYHGETLSPVGAQTRVALRNEHLSYIVTWYSLTGILSYLWYKKIFKLRL